MLLGGCGPLQSDATGGDSFNPFALEFRDLAQPHAEAGTADFPTAQPTILGFVRAHAALIWPTSTAPCGGGGGWSWRVRPGTQEGANRQRDTWPGARASPRGIIGPPRGDVGRGVRGGLTPGQRV